MAEIINKDIDENMEIVDESTYAGKKSSSIKNSSTSKTTHTDNLTHNYSSGSSYTTSSTVTTGRSGNMVKSDKKFFYCPSCRKIIAYQTRKQYCPDCSEDYNDTMISKTDYLYSISEEMYYDLGLLDKKHYMKICFVTNTEGFEYKPFFDKDGYHEDYFCTRFKVQGGKIVEDEDIMNDQFQHDGDFLYDPQTIYNGNVPSGSYFDGYFNFNNYVKPILFKSNGTVVMFADNSSNAQVEDEGRYLREGNLIRTDLTSKDGEFRKILWLIVNGRLCRDAYVNEAGFDAAMELLSRDMPEKKKSFLERLFGK